MPVRERPQPPEHYDHFANSPKLWFWKASALLRSSEELSRRSSRIAAVRKGRSTPMRSQPAKVAEEIDRHSVIQMLRAMWLESLLKGLWLKNGNKLVTGGDYEKIPGTSDHDLLSLLDAVARVTDAKFDELERHLVARLSIAIYSGRYPIPKRWKPQQVRRHPTGVTGLDGYWQFPSDEVAFVRLANRLYELTQ